MSMDMRQTACKNCTERKVGFFDGKPYNCHNHCEKYAEEVRQAKAAKEIYDKKRIAYLDGLNYDCEKHRRLKKKYKSRG